MNPKDYIRASDGNGEAVRAVVTDPRDPGDMSIITDSVFNWPHKFIATSGNLDIETGLLDPDTITIFYGHLDGSIIMIDEFAPGYLDIGHQIGESILLKPTTPWADAVAEAAEQPSLPAGGTAGQILTKVSSTDGDAEWEDAPEPEAGNSIVTKEVPTGTVNGSNTTFTTSQPYTAATLQVYINGLAQSFEIAETNPATGEFTITPAPLTGDNLVVSYMFGAVGTMAADTLDGYHANATPTPNTIPVRNADGGLLQAKIGIIPGSTFGSTGNKSITGVGFKPKMVEFEVLPTNATTSLIIQGRGAMDENGTQYTVAYSSSTSGQARRSETNLALVFMAQTTSVAAAMGFEYVSMNEDGFTLNVLVANGTFDIAYKAYA